MTELKFMGLAELKIEGAPSYVDMDDLQQAWRHTFISDRKRKNAERMHAYRAKKKASIEEA